MDNKDAKYLVSVAKWGKLHRVKMEEDFGYPAFKCPVCETFTKIDGDQDLQSCICCGEAVIVE